MKLKIAIIGEGKNDIGWSAYGKYGEWNEGTVQVFLRKLLDEAEIEFTQIPNSRVRGTALGRGRYRKGGSKKLRGAALKVLPFLYNGYADEHFDLLVFYSDSDKTQRRKATKREALKNYLVKRQEINMGLELVKEKIDLDGIIMMPIRMIENWLLADANAFKEMFGEFPTKPKLPKEPEFIWGDEQDRKSSHPKNYLRRVLEQFGETSHTEIFKEIAENIEIETIIVTCSNSFQPFYEELQRFIESR